MLPGTELPPLGYPAFILAFMSVIMTFLFVQKFPIRFLMKCSELIFYNLLYVIYHEIHVLVTELENISPFYSEMASWPLLSEIFNLIDLGRE